MKKNWKITLACITAVTVLTGCGLSFSTSAEARSLTPDADSASVLTESSVLPAIAELSADIDTDVSKRDASGEYDASKAVYLEPGDDLTITEAGTYILSGTYTDQMVVVDAGSEDKIQIVLDSAEIANADGPAIYIRSADKVFITAADGTENLLSDGTDYTLTDGETELDAAVFSRDDLTLNGAGTLTIHGNFKHGVVSKDDLVITVTSLTVEAENTALHGKDCVKISNAEVTVTAGTDGIRSDNGTDADRGFVSLANSTVTVTAEKDGIQAETYFLSEDSDVTITSGTYTGAQTAKGWGGFPGQESSSSSSSSESYKGVKAGVEIVINGGTWTVESEDDALHTNGDLTITSGSFTLRSGDDAIHANETLTITGGTLDITAYEGIEGTCILISGGDITIAASDDGINAARKSSSLTPSVEISGGTLTITMGAGDTDGIDSNGNILISGGTVSVTGNSTFDYEGTGTITGGTVYVNGEEVSELPNQFMGGFGGGPGGSQGGGWGGPGEDQQGGFGGGFGGGHRG